MRFLIVEDDALLADGLARSLRAGGYTADCVASAEHAALALKNEAFDVVLLDLGLPGMDGFELLARLRRGGNTVPVIVISARDALGDRVKGLDLGADDYLVKPFELSELAARIRALLRRSAGRAEPVVAHGDIELLPVTREVRLRGEPVALSPREFAVLEALLARPGAILSRAQLEEKLYGWNEEVESNAVEVHIHALRRKLGAETIRNVRGVGWMIAKPDRA